MFHEDTPKLLTAIAIAFLAIIAGLFVRQFIYLPFLHKGLQEVKQAFAVPVKIEKSAYEYLHVAHAYIGEELVREVYAKDSYTCEQASVHEQGSCMLSYAQEL